MRGRVRQVSDAIPDRLRGLRPDTVWPAGPDSARRRFLRLNGLSPREQIMYFYLSTVKRAGEQGCRAAGETPAEYATDLKQHWPDTEMDVDDLTSAFIEARYSPATSHRKRPTASRRAGNGCVIVCGAPDNRLMRRVAPSPQS